MLIGQIKYIEPIRIKHHTNSQKKNQFEIMQICAKSTSHAKMMVFAFHQLIINSLAIAKKAIMAPSVIIQVSKIKVKIY